MSEITPLTERPAWRALQQHHAEVAPRHLRELFDEDPVKALVVAPGQQVGRVVGQAEHAQALLAVVVEVGPGQRPLAEVLAEVRGVGAAAAVADEEDQAAVLVRFVDRLGQGVRRAGQRLGVTLPAQALQAREVVMEQHPVEVGHVNPQAPALLALSDRRSIPLEIGHLDVTAGAIH